MIPLIRTHLRIHPCIHCLRPPDSVNDGVHGRDVLWVVRRSSFFVVLNIQVSIYFTHVSVTSRSLLFPVFNFCS